MYHVRVSPRAVQYHSSDVTIVKQKSALTIEPCYPWNIQHLGISCIYKNVLLQFCSLKSLIQFNFMIDTLKLLSLLFNIFYSQHCSIFLLLYFLGGFFATLIPFIRNQDNSGYRSLGSSGAVSAVVFAFVLWNPSADLLVMFIPMKAWFFGILYLSYEIWADKKDQSNIAHDAHIGGALFGILFVLMIDINKGIEFINVFI